MNRRRALRGPIAFLIYGPNWTLIVPALLGVVGVCAALAWVGQALLAKIGGSL